MQGRQLHHENTQNTKKRGAEERKLRERERQKEIQRNIVHQMTLTRSDVEGNQRRMEGRSGRRTRETFLKMRQEDVREETVETHHVTIQKRRGNKKDYSTYEGEKHVQNRNETETGVVSDERQRETGKIRREKEIKHTNEHDFLFLCTRFKTL